MSETLDDTTTAPLNDRDDIRASLEEAFDKATAAPETSEEVETPSAAARARDEAGRFAKTEQTEAPETTEPPPETPETPVEATKAAPKSPEPPTEWAEKDKDAFRKAPPEVQEFMSRRYGEMLADYTRKTTAIAAFRRDYEPVRQMFEPHTDIMRQKGLSPSSLIKGWMDVEQRLTRGEGADVVRGLVQGYRIPVDQIAAALGIQSQRAPAVMGEDGQPVPAPEAPAGSSVPPELQQTLQNVVQWISQTEQQRAQEAMARQQSDAQRVMSEINRFASETAQDGKALRPYFADVEDDMAAIATGIKQKGGDIPPLQELYDNAVWMNPVTRARLLADQAAAVEAQRAEQEAKRQTEARARAAKAQRASTSVVGAPGSGHAARANGTLSLREQLEQAASERL